MKAKKVLVWLCAAAMLVSAAGCGSSAASTGSDAAGGQGVQEAEGTAKEDLPLAKYPEEVIPFSDIILLCVPGYLIQKTLHAIAPYVNNNIEIGTVISSGGFFWMARHELGKEHRLFGFQRVPYISRVKEYMGDAGNLLTGGSGSVRNVSGKTGVNLCPLCGEGKQVTDTSGEMLTLLSELFKVQIQRQMISSDDFTGTFV